MGLVAPWEKAREANARSAAKRFFFKMYPLNVVMLILIHGISANKWRRQNV
jgi:hypothetical protein